MRLQCTLVILYKEADVTVYILRVKGKGTITPRPGGIPARKRLGQDRTLGLSRLSPRPGGGRNKTAQSLPPFSPWLSQAGLMPGALPPSLRLPGPLPETHQSPMGGWCRTLLSPENRQGQLRAEATSLVPGPWKAWRCHHHGGLTSQAAQQGATRRRRRWC